MWNDPRRSGTPKQKQSCNRSLKPLLSVSLHVAVPQTATLHPAEAGSYSAKNSCRRHLTVGVVGGRRLNTSKCGRTEEFTKVPTAGSSTYRMLGSRWRNWFHVLQCILGSMCFWRIWRLKWSPGTSQTVGVSLGVGGLWNGCWGGLWDRRVTPLKIWAKYHRH